MELQKKSEIQEGSKTLITKMFTIKQHVISSNLASGFEFFLLLVLFCS